jgi:hypothetical protein
VSPGDVGCIGRRNRMLRPAAAAMCTANTSMKSAARAVRAAAFLRARFTPHVPEGMMVIPGTTFAAHSLAASSALTPALPASILLCTCSAMLQAPITVPFASSRSSAISSTRSTPGFGCRNGFLTARALVSGSRILNVSPIFYRRGVGRRRFYLLLSGCDVATPRRPPIS